MSVATLLKGIPVSWELVPFEELIVASIAGDWGEPPEFCDPDYELVYCIRASELRDWKAARGRTAALRNVKRSRLAARQLQMNDLLIEISGGGPEQPVGRTVLIDLPALSHRPATPKVCSNFMRRVCVSTEVSSHFIHYYLQFFYKTGEIGQFQGGSSNLRNLKFGQFIESKIPIPPLAEQRLVVAKIEELFSELDKGVENMKQARAQLEVYQQALLKHAFEGKLTAEWRATYPAELEPADRLIALIRAERAAEVPRRKVREQFISSQKQSDLELLPDSWVWTSVSDLGMVVTGTTPPTNDLSLYGDELPFFKPTDLEQGINVRTARDYLSDRGMDHARVLPAGTTLITCIGATIGKTGFARVECATNQQINSITPADSIVPEFIYYQAIGPRFQDQVKTNASSTTLPIINKSKFGRLPFAICSPEEQIEIVRILDQQCSAIAAQESDIDLNLQRAEALRQSILKKAFTGELVPQDPSDESAAELLARIRTERAAGALTPKLRQRSTRPRKPV